jgi:F-type H+-transporting ATPase subunit b
MDTRMLADPVFIAKLVDFVVFVGAIVYVYQRFLKGALVARQESQNKAVADVEAELSRARASVDEARRDIEKARSDAARMVEVGNAQAARLIVEERTAAEQHAQRMLAHANGELERERYRVRRELLEETVERATGQAREIAQRELTPGKQNELVHGVLSGLEAQRA